MEYIDFIKPELLILIPILNVIGYCLKHSNSIKDKHIPLYLGMLGVIFALLYVFSNSALNNIQAWLMCVFVGITQGILCAGASVFANQIYKQEKTK